MNYADIFRRTKLVNTCVTAKKAKQTEKLKCLSPLTVLTCKYPCMKIFCKNWSQIKDKIISLLLETSNAEIKVTKFPNPFSAGII